MKSFRENIWKNGEYNYAAAYGFVPNIVSYLHEDARTDSASADSESSSRASASQREDSKLRPCMIVVPGGGYCMVVPPEAGIVAEEFYGRGMNCFVLTYTSDITMSVPLQKQPMNDLSRAVRYIRKNSARFNIDPGKITVCGFSAGAHVCGSLGVHFEDVTDVDPELNEVSNRPDSMILSYPVITSGEFTHIYSMWALVGKDAPQEEYEYFSLEKHVTENTPPTFIWQTVEDNLVPVENSMLFAEACRKNHVPYAYYAFPHGWHGLSVHNEAFRKGAFGEEYTMEQVMAAVEAVRAGKGINVSEERCKELIEQFSQEPPKPEGEMPKFDDVALWPDLAEAWLKSL